MATTVNEIYTSATTIHPQFLREIMTAKNYKYWKILNDDRTLVMQENSGMDVSESASKLMQFLNSGLAHGSVIVEIAGKPYPFKKTEKNDYLIFKIEKNKYDTPAPTPMPVLPLESNKQTEIITGMLEKNHELQLKLVEQAYKNHIEQLTKELIEMRENIRKLQAMEFEDYPDDEEEEEEENFAKTLINGLKPYMPQLIGKIIPGVTALQPTAMAGTDDNPPSAPNTETPEQRQANTLAAINRLYAIDPDLDKSLTALANFAEKNTDSYFSYLKLIS